MQYPPWQTSACRASCQVPLKALASVSNCQELRGSKETRLHTERPCAQMHTWSAGRVLNKQTAQATGQALLTCQQETFERARVSSSFNIPADAHGLLSDQNQALWTQLVRHSSLAAKTCSRQSDG